MSNKPIDPGHYTLTKIEPISVIEAWHLGFHLGNAVKYIARANIKGSRHDDLIKAANYCFREATGRWLPQEVLNELVSKVGEGDEEDTR